MPLMIKCRECGEEHEVEKMEEERKGFIFEYSCKNKNLKVLEEIPKRSW